MQHHYEWNQDPGPILFLNIKIFNFHTYIYQFYFRFFYILIPPASNPQWRLFVVLSKLLNLQNGRTPARTHACNHTRVCGKLIRISNIMKIYKVYKARNFYLTIGSVYTFTYRVWWENLYTPIIYNVLSCMNATETCNTAIKREFCGLSSDYFENCEKLSYEA